MQSFGHGVFASESYTPLKLTARHWKRKRSSPSGIIFQRLSDFFFGGGCKPSTLQETNISPKNGILKIIFLFPRWDMLVPWRVNLLIPMHRRFFVTVPRICSLIDRSSGEGFTDRFLRRLALTDGSRMHGMFFWRNDVTWLGGFKEFVFLPRTLGKESNLTLIFLKWVAQPPARWYLMRHIYRDDIRCDMIFLFLSFEKLQKKWHRWHYYFTYCETGFRRKHIDVWQFLGRAASAPFACLCRYEIHSGWLVGCCGIFRNPHDPLMFMACPIFHCGLRVWIAAWQFESSKDVFWERSWLCWCWAA